ncbi:MAG: hypothetical protein ABIA04_15255 [Pseudomonadota bacterium]
MLLLDSITMTGPWNQFWNKFSSYAYYAEGKEDPLITPSPIYEGLGCTPKERQKKYQELIESFMDAWEAVKERLHEECKYFIGEASWVNEKKAGLSKIMKEKYQKWRKN